MVYQLFDDDYWFPDPCDAEGQETLYPGLLAIGGDLSPERLIEAYSRGIFPWYNEGEPILWWSLDPRMVLLPGEFRYSKSLRRVVESGRFEMRVDTCFEQVMRSCAAVQREGQDGTWITEAMIEAYCELHRMGVAHSFETFCDGELVGGLYGVSLGRFFCGESMFHKVRDASKVAFVKLVEYSLMHGFRFIDAQQPTGHLASLGAKEMDRKEFLGLLLEEMSWGEGRGRSVRSVRNNLSVRGGLNGRSGWSGLMDFLGDTVWGCHSVVFSMGGNQGDVAETMDRACEMISESIGRICCVSRDYESEPWGFDHPVPNFVNRCVVVDTELSPREVLEKIMGIERELGRQRLAVSGQSLAVSGQRSAVGGQRLAVGGHYSSRPIDIDILFYDSRVIDTSDLQVPHPRLHLRRFVLEPLAELMPQFTHPLLKKSIAELRSACDDTGKVLIR